MKKKAYRKCKSKYPDNLISDIEAEGHLEKGELLDYANNIENVVSLLNKNERELVRLYYVECATLHDIEETFNKSNGSIQYMKRGMLRKLSSAMYIKALKHDDFESWEKANIKTFSKETPITMLHLPARAENALLRNHIETIGALSNLTEKDLARFSSVGYNAVMVIRSRMEKAGFSIKESFDRACYPYNLIDAMFVKRWSDDALAKIVPGSVDLALELLGEEERSVLTRIYKEGYTYDEIIESPGSPHSMGGLQNTMKTAGEKLNSFYFKTNDIFTDAAAFERVKNISEGFCDATPLTKVGIPYRIWHALAKVGVVTVGDLATYSTADLSNVNGLGGMSVNIVVEEMKKIGYELKTSTQPA